MPIFFIVRYQSVIEIYSFIPISFTSSNSIVGKVGDAYIANKGLLKGIIAVAIG